MKNLKIKFGLFSLLVVLAVSVFLTSCEQENITEVLPKTMQHSMNDIVVGDYIAAPYGIGDLQEAEQIAYFNQLQEEYSEEALAVHTKIFSFLIMNDRVEEVGQDMNIGDIYTKSNVSNHLSLEEIQHLDEYISSKDDIDFRWHLSCDDWSFVCYLPTVAPSPNGQCQYYEIDVRKCYEVNNGNWYGPYFQGRYRGLYSTYCSTVYNNQC